MLNFGDKFRLLGMILMKNADTQMATHLYPNWRQMFFPASVWSIVRKNLPEEYPRFESEA